MKSILCKLSFALFSALITTRSFAFTDITCNNGAMTIETLPALGLESPWSRLRIHDDGVAYYFLNSFHQHAGRSWGDQDCYGGVCSFSFDHQYVNAEFLGRRYGKYFRGFNGQHSSSYAEPEGQGMRVKFTIHGETVNWLFEKCTFQN